MRKNRFRCALWIAASLTCTSVAAADLQSDVMRLMERLSSNRPYHLGPRILEQGDELPLLLPSALVESPPRCLHIVALAAQSVAFSLNMPSADAEVDDVSVPSRAGVIEFIRCGEAGVSLSDANVMMLSPRGVVDIVGYIENGPRPSVARILPWRAAGDEAPERNVSHVTPSVALAARLDRLELQAALQAADRTERRIIPREDAKSGQLLIGFDPGCHQLQLVAERSDRGIVMDDLDPELVWADNEQPAARELSSSSTPTFRVCTAVARVAKLSFSAFEKDAGAVLFRARFPWPNGIPSNWAVQARNQMAEALFRRHLPSLPSLPSQAWIGGSSATSLVVPVAPRSCYLAMVATSQGSTNDVTLAVTAESRWMADNSFDNAGAGVAFCVNQAKSVKLDVDSRGTDVVWILGLWNVAGGPTHADFT